METPQQPQIKLSDTTEVACPCGCTVFQIGAKLRGVSAILSGTGKSEVIPTQVLFCAKCLTPYTPPTIIT
jgi:hypothetical protein